MSNQNNEGLIKEISRDSGYGKAAKFLILLGEEEAARVLKHLSEEEIEGVTREIAAIERVDGREAKKILEEFGYLARSRNLLARGGLERAREMLEAAFGKEKGEIAYQRLLEKTDYLPFSFISSLDFNQVLTILREESVPVISLIISCLEPPMAAKILTGFPKEMQKDLARRVGRMDKVSPDVLRQAEESLRQKIKRQGTTSTLEIDGKSALTEIMKYLDVGTENYLLDELAEKDPELADTIKKKLFNIDVINKIRDRDLQRVLRDFTDREIALMLKGKSESLKQKVYENISARRREMIKLEYEDLGEVLKSDADKVTLEFMNFIRRQVEMGELLIVEEREEVVE